MRFSASYSFCVQQTSQELVKSNKTVRVIVETGSSHSNSSRNSLKYHYWRMAAELTRIISAVLSDVPKVRGFSFKVFFRTCFVLFRLNEQAGKSSFLNQLHFFNAAFWVSGFQILCSTRHISFLAVLSGLMFWRWRLCSGTESQHKVPEVKFPSGEKKKKRRLLSHIMIICYFDMIFRTFHASSFFKFLLKFQREKVLQSLHPAAKANNLIL